MFFKSLIAVLLFCSASTGAHAQHVVTSSSGLTGYTVTLEPDRLIAPGTIVDVTTHVVNGNPWQSVRQVRTPGHVLGEPLLTVTERVNRGQTICWEIHSQPPINSCLYGHEVPIVWDNSVSSITGWEVGPLPR